MREKGKYGIREIDFKHFYSQLKLYTTGSMASTDCMAY